MKKKKWDNPKLIVLFRPRSEEMVLVVCKGPGRKVSPNIGCKKAGGAVKCNLIVTS
jgi:hypothetical protein